MTVETCEINPDENQYCFISSEVHAAFVVCELDCIITDVFPCSNITTSDHFQFCCNAPYCNNLTSIPTLLSSTPPSPSPKLVTLLIIEYVLCVVWFTAPVGTN